MNFERMVFGLTAPLGLPAQFSGSSKLFFLSPEMTPVNSAVPINYFCSQEPNTVKLGYDEVRGLSKFVGYKWGLQ